MKRSSSESHSGKLIVDHTVWSNKKDMRCNTSSLSEKREKICLPTDQLKWLLSSICSLIIYTSETHVGSQRAALIDQCVPKTNKADKYAKNKHLALMNRIQ